MSIPQIKYLDHRQIDKKKWDELVTGSPNGLIYAQSFYLDNMAKQWDALVLNDYEAVMPLTWNKKWGIRYLYQPFLCASLGIFGRMLSPAITKAFLQTIPDKFLYIDISLNQGNLFLDDAISGLYERENYVLDLGEPYETLYSRFNDNVKRNIKKALQNGCVVTKPLFAEVMALAKKQLAQLTVLAAADYSRFARLYHLLEQKKLTATYGIAAPGGQLLASCAFLFWQNRAYYILVGNHPDSKSTGASHALINAFVKDHANTGTMLDFEGSDLPGLALFYSSFGAAKEKYPALRSNRLPAFLKWLKR